MIIVPAVMVVTEEALLLIVVVGRRKKKEATCSKTDRIWYFYRTFQRTSSIPVIGMGNGYSSVSQTMDRRDRTAKTVWIFGE